MRIARVEWAGETRWAEVEGASLHALERGREGWVRAGALGPLDQARLLAPIEPHNKIIGLLDNFSGRKARRGPGLFLKPMSAVIGPGDDIRWPDGVPAVNFEAELAVVIGRRAKGVSAAEALDHVLGYTIANDMTSFPTLMEDGPASLSTRFKLFDNFLPLGPWIVTDLNPDRLSLTATLNGELKQDANTADMAFGVAETVAWISAVMTLEPGDVISMGTPPGFVEMQRGDVVTCCIEGIGALENPLV